MGSFKERRKHSKYKQILKAELNISASEEPSQYLMVGNAGLVSGVQLEQLATLFTKYGTVKKVIMIPGKSYSFIIYSTTDGAKEAFNAINGQIKLDNMDGPMYLLYTNSVPEEFSSELYPSVPDGINILTDFVSVEEEECLLGCVNWDTNNLDTDKSLKHRRVKHFGYEFRYDNNNVDKDSPLEELIPQECEFIPGRLCQLGYPLPWTPNQLTVNQYKKGQGIPSHIDTHSAFESPLLSLSLGSDVIMEFRRGSQHVPVLLPRRSLLIMDGQARYAWSHGITPRTMDVVPVAGGLTVCERGCRTSFTFRRVRPGPCNCPFPEHCDSQCPPSPHILDHQASKLEELYVHQVYNNIASHFSSTRSKVWPNVQEFLKSFSPGAIIIDAGCGNGKYFGVNPNTFQVGFDRSVSLAEITWSRGNEVFLSDCLYLPVRDNIANGVISIAVLHHLSTRERRLQAIQEMSRVLVPGGRALISVWAKDQTKQKMTAYLKQDRKNRRKGSDGMTVIEPSNDNKSKEISMNDILQGDTCLDGEDFKLPIHTARTEFKHQDVFVPWKVKSKAVTENAGAVFLRYYHVFEENELHKLCRTIKDINILQTYYTEGNWCIIFEKSVL